jgi:hypothetical protein
MNQAARYNSPRVASTMDQSPKNKLPEVKAPGTTTIARRRPVRPWEAVTRDTPR